MSTYLKVMQDIGKGTAFGRRVGYLKYNFSEYLKECISQKQKVLEIGPGTGELEYLLNKEGFSNIDIIDNDQAVLDYCKGEYQIRDAILSKSLDITKSLKGRYDLIFLTQVFEHIPKTSYLNWIKGLYEVLNPGGHIVITVPNGANPLVGTERYGCLQHENVFTIFSFQELMIYANLKNSSYIIKGFRIPPIDLINIIRIILQKILHWFFILIMMVNGAIYQTLMTPNITLIIKKERS